MSESVKNILAGLMFCIIMVEIVILVFVWALYPEIPTVLLATCMVLGSLYKLGKEVRNW